MNIACISDELLMFLYCKLFWIKVSAKCVNVNVNWDRARKTLHTSTKIEQSNFPFGTDIGELYFSRYSTDRAQAK